MDYLKKCELPTYESFRLKRLILRFSMDEIKDKTGVSKSTISRFESGKEILYSNLIKLNDFYNSEIDKLK